MDAELEAVQTFIGKEYRVVVNYLNAHGHRHTVSLTITNEGIRIGGTILQKEKFVVHQQARNSILLSHDNAS